MYTHVYMCTYTLCVSNSNTVGCYTFIINKWALFSSSVLSEKENLVFFTLQHCAFGPKVGKSD